MAILITSYHDSCSDAYKQTPWYSYLLDPRLHSYNALHWCGGHDKNNIVTNWTVGFPYRLGHKFFHVLVQYLYCSAQTRTGMGHLRRPPGVELIPAID